MEPGLSSARSSRDAVVLTDSAMRIVSQHPWIKDSCGFEPSGLQVANEISIFLRKPRITRLVSPLQTGASALYICSHFRRTAEHFLCKNNTYQTTVKPLSEQWRKVLILLRFVHRIFA